MLTIEDINSKKYFSNLYKNEYVQRNVLRHSLENLSLEKIWKDEKKLFTFYFRIVELKALNIEREDFFNIFPYETLKHILFKCSSFRIYMCRDVERIIFKKYPDLEMYEPIVLSSWQTFSGHIKESNIAFYFEALNNLENPLDDRFSIYPTFSHGSPRGSNRGDWFRNLKNKKGELDNSHKHHKKNAYQDIYLDGKLGFIIYFKNKPSMIVSFQVDDNNVYVNQIQSVKKDRGHYKIEGNWREFLLNYVGQIFKGKQINLISGYTSARVVISGYRDKKTINQSRILKSCIESYNKPFSHFLDKFRLSTREGLFTYRILEKNNV